MNRSFPKVIKIISESRGDSAAPFKNLEELLEDKSVKRIIKLLMRNDARINRPQRCNCHDTKKILKLLEKYDWGREFRTIHGENLLHLFVRQVKRNDRGAASVAKILLDLGLPINKLNRFGNSLLQDAICTGNVSLVNVFIEKGANVNQKSRCLGTFPLFTAVQCKNEILVDLLLSRGAEVDAETSFDWTALHEACFLNNKKVIDKLVNNNADVTALCENGRPPAFYLNRDHKDYYLCLCALVKGLSKLMFEDVPLFGYNSHLMENYPAAKYFSKICMDELRNMSTAVQKRSQNVKELAKLVRDRKFVTNFNHQANSYFPHNNHDL